MLSDSALNPLTKQRIEFIDLLKCFAIFGVLWQHAVPGLNNANVVRTSEHYAFADPVFTFFITFHMPLFFMISGFFFVSSLNLSFNEVLRKRFFVLIIPHIAWIIILAFADYGMTFLGWRRASGRPFTVPGQLVAFLTPDPDTDLWFFRELFVTDLLVFIFCKLFKKRYILAFVASMLFVTLFDWFGLTTRAQRYMMPVFWTGILLKAYYPVFTKHLNKFIISFGILFVVCCYFYLGNPLVYGLYFNKYQMAIINFQQSLAEGKLVLDFTNSGIGIGAFRSFTGIAGSIFFFALFQRFWKKNTVTSFLSRCGQLTVAIYGIQCILLMRIMGNVLDFSGTNIWLYRFVITPIAAVFAFFGCVLITRLIQKNKRLAFILFGSSLVDRSVRQDSVQIVASHGAV
ncbi:hypothetical protein PilKf_02366 [Pillotina sp. SPG140]|jgi:fucose 4-O-acetylase-like acetyltransferase